MSLPMSIITNIYDTPGETYVHSLWRDLPKKRSYSTFKR